MAIPITGSIKQHWFGLSVVVAAYALSLFHRFAPASVALDLATTFHTSAASLGVLAATYFYVYTLIQIPTGVMVDTLGPRCVLVGGCIIAGIGSVMFGLADGIPAAFAGRMLVGLGVSVTFVSMLKVISIWFDENRFATLVGLSMLIGNCGSILAGAPLSLVSQTVGWRSVFVSVGLLSMAICIGCWWFVRACPLTAGQQGEGAGFDGSAALKNLLSVVRNPATWPPAVVNFGLAGSFFAFGGLWAMPYLTQVQGLSRTVASNHLSLYYAGFALGCVGIGALSDALGRRRPVMIAGATVNATIWLVWLSGLQLPAFLSYGLIACMGLTTASYSLSWACAKEVNPPALSGMSSSVANVGGFLAGAILQPLIGWIMDQRWSGAMLDGARLYSADDFRLGLMLAAAAAWVGVVAATRIRETCCRNIYPAQSG
ncbi:MAG: MFS transporter [Betaproteobacteria bacterium]